MLKRRDVLDLRCPNTAMKPVHLFDCTEKSFKYYLLGGISLLRAYNNEPKDITVITENNSKSNL